MSPRHVNIIRRDEGRAPTVSNAPKPSKNNVLGTSLASSELNRGSSDYRRKRKWGQDVKEGWRKGRVVAESVID